MASAKRNAEARLKAKEAKQKKLLFVLVPIFLGLAVWQGPEDVRDALRRREGVQRRRP